MPCAPSMRTCASLARTSCCQSRLSNGIEAFIARITAEGPSAKRPPHIALELSLRPVIALILIALAAGGCDRRSATPEQANETSLEAAANAAAASAAETPPLEGQLDRSHKG